jgi:pyruvate,orthophosphate dikinase
VITGGLDGTEPLEDRLVYDFAEGSREMRDLLGGKGANVAEMTRVLGPERVPAGFTITTEACVAYLRSGGEMPEGLESQLMGALERLQTRAGLSLGDPVNPSSSRSAPAPASRCRGCSTRC